MEEKRETEEYLPPELIEIGDAVDLTFGPLFQGPRQDVHTFYNNDPVPC